MLSRKLITFGLEMQTELESCAAADSVQVGGGTIKICSVFTKCQKAARFGQKSNWKFVLQAQWNAYTIRVLVQYVYDTLASGKRVQTGSNAHEATRRLCLNIKSHAEESWFVQYGKVWYMVWLRMADLTSMFGFWAPPALLQYTYVQYIHFANTILTILCGKRCAAVTGSNCGRVATCHATRFTAYVSVSALAGIGSGRAVHIRSAPG